jgi:hypothetical protein
MVGGVVLPGLPLELGDLGIVIEVANGRLNEPVQRVAVHTVEIGVRHEPILGVAAQPQRTDAGQMRGVRKFGAPPKVRIVGCQQVRGREFGGCRVSHSSIVARRTLSRYSCAIMEA